jgi:hypothetical protein
LGEADDADRLAVVAAINGVEYPEYVPCGWLKAWPLSRLRVDGPAARERFTAYAARRADGVALRL